MGKGKGAKGKATSSRSEEEIRHARLINAQREGEDLPKKSPGSVSRAKARSAAFHAAKAAAREASTIGMPIVKPPAPPPPPPRGRVGANAAEAAGEGIRLVERGELLPTKGLKLTASCHTVPPIRLSVYALRNLKGFREHG